MSTQQPLSQVVPLLEAALICDVAVADPNTGKKNLIGIFNRLNVGSFPTQRTLYIYFKISDAEGFYNVDVRFVQVATGIMLAQGQGEISISDRLGSTDLYIGFPPLVIPEAGRYEFQIWANSMFLGSTSMDATPRQPPTAGG